MANKKHTEITGNKEESHSDWGITDFQNITSGRRYPLGWFFIRKRVKYLMIDKYIMPIDACPFCKSKKTYHKRQSSIKNAENVWRNEIQDFDETYKYTKFDFCLDCQNEFIMEYFLYNKSKLTFIQYLKELKLIYKMFIR